MSATPLLSMCWGLLQLLSLGAEASVPREQVLQIIRLPVFAQGLQFRHQHIGINIRVVEVDYYCK